MTDKNMINMYLLNELLLFSNKCKAERVYNKCLRRGKVGIANRIKYKYGIESKHDDAVSALWYALTAIKTYKNGHDAEIYPS